MSVVDRGLNNRVDTDLGGSLRLEVTDDRVLANASGHLRIAWLCCWLIRLSVMVQVRLLASGDDGVDRSAYNQI